MVTLATMSFAGAIALPALGIVGGSFVPVQDVSEFNVIIESPPGSNIGYTRVKAEEVARLARAKKEVAYTYTTIGGSGGGGGGSRGGEEGDGCVRVEAERRGA